MRLPDFLDKQAAVTPDAVAIRDGERHTTYQELVRATCKLANRLLRENLDAGARIAVYTPNHTASFVCQYGIHRTPHMWMPLNPRADIQEILSLLSDFGASWLFIHGDFARHLPAIRQANPQLMGCVCVDRALRDAPQLEAWYDDAEDDLPSRPGRPDDGVALRTTGGSTGKSKGVVRTSISNALIIADYLIALPYETPPVNLVLTPLSHAAGEVALPIFAVGGCHVILNFTEPSEILAAIERYRVTTVFLPPTLIYVLLAQPDLRRFDLSSLRYVLYGSAPMAVQKLREACEIFGPVFAQIYGLTEATSTLCIMTPREHEIALTSHPGRLASCGRPGPMYMLRIVDDQGREVEPGAKGEIVCRSEHLMKQYFENPAATAEACQGGWLRSGDIGIRDEAGYVYIVDRKKDLIISGGFNVYPGEIEQVIFQHPAVRDCSVIGVPDDKWGEAVTAVIELNDGAEFRAEELISLCKSKLGSIKAPKNVVVWPSLPRSPVGKILKKEIRAEFWKDAGRVI